jgi:hypothetical protein
VIDARLELPSAPTAAVGADGTIQYGRYLGAVPQVDWRRIGPNRVWRFLHWKRWQYASFMGPEVVGAVAIADVGLVTTAFAYLFDRRTRRVVADVSLTAGSGAGHVAEHVLEGSLSTFRRGDARFSIEHRSGAWEVEVRSPDFEISARMAEGPTAATIAAIARVPGGIANCSHKTHGLNVSGTARAGRETQELGEALGALDHTSGLLARDTSWRWASGTSELAAINLVEGFQEPLENALWQRGRITPLPPVDFTRESGDPMTVWRVRSKDLSTDLRFEPEGVRSQDKNLVLAVSRWIQPIGTWTGIAGGVDVGRLTGVLEDHVARW